MADQKLQPSITVQQARGRLDAALEKLEKAVDGAPAGGDKMSGLAAELSDARTEITALEKKNAEVSERLGSAIGKVKAIIGD
ncbi:MAG: DUF4164 family protein [Rhodospirillaceae bacterium]|nr:DUF4164 family protein [Rhodospirillaceae bacterium]MBT3887551.1 DUF4164 family protein [Rhodospirillaceae bacterium]MBT4118682.1 DUF4164 family protein [Rhodospirillaceae bacterium]MBT4674190.1 DUF4164 family protein [Rhodospirillaceae bacterium]MBT4718302.1 DUF4164 family protein [Rhodospirillaceae bacterium]